MKRYFLWFLCFKEENIDEFYTGIFSPDGTKIALGGKMKDRKRWSKDDDDNHIMACPIKIFDLIESEVVAKLEGHAEEILCIKYALFKGEHHLVTSSQDGYIHQWKVDTDWSYVSASFNLQEFDRNGAYERRNYMHGF
jgi:WD40 repeat protein